MFGTANPPALTPQEVYDQCMAKSYTDPPQYKTSLMHLRKTICEIRRDRVARGVDPDAVSIGESALAEDPAGDAFRRTMERQRQNRQELFNECLSRAVLPFHCSY